MVWLRGPGTLYLTLSNRFKTLSLLKEKDKIYQDLSQGHQLPKGMLCKLFIRTLNSDIFKLFDPSFHHYCILYNKQINARTLIGQSAVGYCAGKPMEKLRFFYKSNRPQVSMGYKLINHMGCW